ncbi:MFS transporter [Nocardioides marmoraquaticus]
MDRKYATLVTVCLAALTINANTTIVNIALPTLAEELDAGTRSLLWIVDGYNLAFAALVLAMGSLSDRFGRRPALILGLVGFALTSAASGLVDSSDALVALRFTTGVTAAIIFPTTLSIIANVFPDRRDRATALGVWGASVGVGVAVGPVAGGYLLEHFSWQSIFWAQVPLALLTAAMAAVLVPESRDPSVPRIDKPGFAISVAALGLLTWSIIEGPEHGWSSGESLTGFGAAAVLLVVFVLVERAVEHPMIDVTLFLDRRFSAACAAVTIAFFAMFGFIFLVTQYFQFVQAYSPLGTGLRFLPVAGSIAAASIVGGLLAPRLGTKLVVTPGLVALGAAFLWISTMDAGAPYGSVIVPQMLLLGVGIGLISTPATESILRVLPPSRAGVGSAVNDATRELGGTLGVAVVGSLFASQYADRLVSLARGRLPEDLLAEASDSVGVAFQVAQQAPPFRAALDTAFMDGMAFGCTVVGVLCLVGAVGAAIALPGDRYDPSGPPADDPAENAGVETSLR